MKVILTMAMSANGMIASKNGSEDFLSHTNWLQFVKLASEVGCFIWGRKTYEAVIKWEDDYLNALKGVKKIILSQSEMELQEGFVLKHSPEEALHYLENKGFQEAIITGGASINSEFAKRSLIDEIILDVNPSVLGEGIPVFNPTDFELSLELVSAEKINDGIVELRYKVRK